jgi:hypothetical protein
MADEVRKDEKKKVAVKRISSGFETKIIQVGKGREIANVEVSLDKYESTEDKTEYTPKVNIRVNEIARGKFSKSTRCAFPKNMTVEQLDKIIEALEEVKEAL